MIKQRTLNYYDFHEMRDLVDKELGIDQRNCGKLFFPETKSFDEWYESKNYSPLDEEGKKSGSSQIWFAEFKEAIASGEIGDTPYCDYWHFQLDWCFMPEISNGCYVQLYVGADFHWAHQESVLDIKPWQWEVQKVWNKLFGDLADEEGYVDVHVWW